MKIRHKVRLEKNREAIFCKGRQELLRYIVCNSIKDLLSFIISVRF
jgi:hypothetical protein